MKFFKTSFRQSPIVRASLYKKLKEKKIILRFIKLPVKSSRGVFASLTFSKPYFFFRNKIQTLDFENLYEYYLRNYKLIFLYWDISTLRKTARQFKG